MKFTRRDAIRLGLALWVQAENHMIAAQTGFLSSKEMATLNRYAAIMIPPTERSGGAEAAGVDGYISGTLANAAPSLQRAWRRGLAAWGEAGDAEARLQADSAHEFEPKTAADQFFILFKAALTSAFYTSQEGIVKELGYQGLAHLHSFPGYDGTPFQPPANYKPLLRSRS